MLTPNSADTLQTATNRLLVGLIRWDGCIIKLNGIKGHGMAGYLSEKGAELCEKLFQEVKSLTNDPETIRSASMHDLT